MPMIPYYERFPRKAFREMRSILVFEHDSLPPGRYGFLELYCNETGCDCRHVHLQVLRADTGPRIWASISYGWEDRAFYEKKLGDRELAQEMAGASLDPINPQTVHSQALLEIFRNEVLTDTPYTQRLERHYREFKNKGASAHR